MGSCFISHSLGACMIPLIMGESDDILNSHVYQKP